jgi:hypothetical protein
LTGCGDSNKAQVERIAEIKGVAQANAAWPDLPTDCRQLMADQALAKAGDRLDGAYLRAMKIVQAQDARIQRCAAWYDGQQSERAK